MKRLVIAAALVAACANSQKDGELPLGSGDIRTHEDYAKFRPVAIAIVPVDAPVHALRTQIRREVYKRITAKKYSPFKLQTVDAHMESNGTFKGHELDWDATLAVKISRWRPVKGRPKFFEADGKARLVHKNGDLLWECSFRDTPVPVEPAAAQIDFGPAAEFIAGYFIQRLPERPPLPRE